MEKKDLEVINDLSILCAEDINSISMCQGEKFAGSIKTNQIRNVFAAINKIRALQRKKRDDVDFAEIQRELILLKPKLAYAAGRNSNVRPFKDFLTKAIDGVIGASTDRKTTALNNFYSLIESVVAYHKFYGGKE